MKVASTDELVVDRTSVWELAAAEARWLLRRRGLWFGVALMTAVAAYLFSRGESQWQGDFYTRVAMVVMPWAIFTFAIAIRYASRDEPNADPAFAPAVPLGHPDRMVGRAIGLGVPVAGAAMLAIIVGVGSRIEGGYWIGDAPFRTDTAQHTWIELAQMPLVTFVLGAAGLAIGRFVPRRALGVVTGIGVAVLVLGTMGWWVFNQPPIHSVALVQTQPLGADVPDLMTQLDFDKDWLMAGPGEFEPRWRRQIVHRPTIIAHHIYLAAAGVALCAAAVRTRRSRRVLLAAVVVAIAAVAAQIALYPEVTA